MKNRKVRLYLFAFFMIVVSVSLILISLAIISKKEEAIDVKAIIEGYFNVELGLIENTILAVEDIDGDEIYEFIIGLYCSNSSYLCVLSSDREPILIKEFGVTSPFSSGDIDDDGFSEIVILEKNELSIYNSSGELFKSYSLPPSDPLPQMIKPVLIDSDNDGILEIILAGNKELFQFNFYEEEPRLIPLKIEDKIISIAVGRDGKGEIVVGAKNGSISIISGGMIKVIETGLVYEESFINPDFVVFKNILLWTLDKYIIGHKFNAYPLFGGKNFIEINEKITGLVVGEIDKRPVMAVSTIDGKGYLFNMEGEPLPGWRVKVSYPVPIYAKPLVTNSKIIFVSSDGSVKVYNVDGSIYEGLSYKIEGRVISTPILKDLDQDEVPELMVLTADGKLYILVIEEDVGTGVEEEGYDEEFYEGDEEYYLDEGEEEVSEEGGEEEYSYTGPTYEEGETDGEYVVYEVEPAYLESTIRFFDRHGREITGKAEEEEPQEETVEEAKEELEEKVEISKEAEEEIQIIEEEWREIVEEPVSYPESIELPVTRTGVYRKEEPAFEMPQAGKIEIIQKEKPKTEIPLHQTEISSPKDEFKIFLKMQQRITDFFKRMQRLFRDRIHRVYSNRKT